MRSVSWIEICLWLPLVFSIYALVYWNNSGISTIRSGNSNSSLKVFSTKSYSADYSLLLLFFSSVAHNPDGPALLLDCILLNIISTSALSKRVVSRFVGNEPTSTILSLLSTLQSFAIANSSSNYNFTVGFIKDLLYCIAFLILLTLQLSSIY